MKALAQSFLAAALLAAAIPTSNAVEPGGPATLGQADAGLAVAAPDSDAWSVLKTGDRLPDNCRARTSALAPAVILLDAGAMVVGEDARLDFDRRARRVAVERGRVVFRGDSADEESWSLEAAGLVARPAAESAVELRVFDDGSRVEAAVTEGTVSVGVEGRQPKVVAAGNACSWKRDADDLSVAPLDAGRRRQIEAQASLDARAQGLGQLLVEDVQSDSAVRLDVARYHVNVVIHPPVALVQIDQSFYNPYGRQEEGTFVFNLPRGASVSRFAMYVTPRERIEGELIERKRASSIYESIVRQKRDPAILEQIGENLFRMRVFPIFARDTKRILLDYTVPLESERGECRFRLPLFSDLEPIWDFGLSGTVLGPAAGTVSSQTHPDLKFTPQPDGSVRFDFRQRDYKPTSDLVLRFAQNAGAGGSVRSYTAEPLPPRWDSMGRLIGETMDGERQTYFTATVPQAVDEAKHDARPPADVLILADTSSGMRDRKSLCGAVRTIAESLGGDDRVRLGCVDVNFRPLGDRWLAGDDPGVERALAELDRQVFLGETDLLLSLRVAAREFKDRPADRRRLVVYVGDGRQTAFPDDTDEVADRLSLELEKAGARLIGVLTEHAPEGRAVIETAARRSAGYVFDLAGSAVGSRELFGWCLAGVPDPRQIVAVEAAGANGEDLFYPASCLPGQTVRVYGRLPATDQISLKLVVADGGHRETHDLSARVATSARPSDDGPSDDVFVGRLWAQRKLEELRRQEREAPGREADAIRDRIVALSQEWSLLSPYTAFLVLEGEADYARWNIDRRMRRRYWNPAGMRPEVPLSEKWVARVAARHRVSTTAPAADADDLASLLAAARKSLESGDAGRAYSLLEQAQDRPAARRSDAYGELRRQALVAVQREAAFRQMGPARAMFDPAAGVAWFRFRPGIQPLLTPVLTANPDFLRRHPYAEHLLKRIEVRPHFEQADRLSLLDVVAMLKEAGPMNVVIDRAALDDVGLDPGEEFSSFALGRMPVGDYARFLLSQLDLVMVEEPHRLWITTPDEAETRLETEVYPVADLYYPDRVADLPLLADPYLDRDQVARDRIKSRLKRPMSVGFRDASLRQVVERFADVLGDPVAIDLNALNDVGLDMETPTEDAAWQDVPAGDSLAWLLRPLDLDYMIDRGALVVSTPEEIESHEIVRLHSGRGIVFSETISAEEYRRRQEVWGERGMGFMGYFGGGFGGMAGGMGGATFGGGGGGGGFGGGFGGRGGMAATGGGVLDEPAAANPPVAISSGGEAVFDQPAGRAEGSAPGAGGSTSPDDVPAATEAAPIAPGSVTFYDADSVIDNITTTIEPTSWDTVGGPGAVDFFSPTVDFVFSQTDAIHDEVEALFQRLKALPAAPGHASQEAVDRPPAEPDSSPDGFLWELIEIIAGCVKPVTWDTVGGPGSITPDEYHTALIVSTTADVQDEISRLLTMFRRSRWEALRHTRPWENGTLWSTSESVAAPTITELPNATSAADLPEPEAKELELLAVRRDPQPRAERWRRTASDDDDPVTVELRQSGGRVELRMPDGTVRLDGGAAAVAYPSLGLVELDDRAEAVRRMLDAWIPWMPHRSNDELARLFSVEAVANERGEDDEPGVARLRLVPSGMPESAGTYVEMAFSRETGQVVDWESHRDGRLAGRITFDGPKATLADASGRTTVRWQRLDREPLAGEIPELTAGWDGLLLWDSRAQKAGTDASLRAALDSIRRFKWQEAAAQVNAALEKHPGQPLLLLLKAWCIENDSRLGRQEDVLNLLEQVGRSRATSLVHFISLEHFPWLFPETVYQIISQVQPDARTAETWDDLARAATAADKLPLALEHTEASLALGGTPEARFARHKRRVELLFKLDRTDEARDAARRWAATPEANADRLATMAETLATFGQEEAAVALFEKAAGLVEANADARYHLLRRWADTQQGEARWRLLIRAALVYPPGSTTRASTMSIVLSELGQPGDAEIAGVLADEIDDPAVSAQLMIRQAEITLNPDQAAEVCRRLDGSGRLPAERRTWALETWDRADWPEVAIEAAERWLRGDPASADDAFLRELAAAYRAAGRDVDARRAETSDRPVPRAPRRMGGGMF